MSWKANSSMEKFQNSTDVGEHRVDFFEYLLPRLFPSQTSYPRSTSWKGRHRSSSVRDTHTSLFISKP